MGAFDDFKAVVAAAEAALGAAIDNPAAHAALVASIGAAEDAYASAIIGVSPDYSIVTTVGPSLVDAGHHVWTLSSQTGEPNWPDTLIFKDGVWAYGGGALLLTIKAGVIYARNSSNVWWRDTGIGWVQTTKPIPLPPPQEAIPPIPAEVSASGCNVQTFFDDYDSLDTIDAGNTQAPGIVKTATDPSFNWYPTPYFSGPNVSWENPGPPWTPTPPTAISVANSVLTLTGDVSGFAEGLISTVDNNVPLADRSQPLAGDAYGPYYSVDPGAYKGVAFKGEWYWDCALCYDASKARPGESWLSDWSMPQRFLTGADASPSNRDYVETDRFEAMSDSTVFAMNAWHNPRPPDTTNFTTNSNARTPEPIMQTGQWVVLGVHKKPATATTQGFKRTYINGVHKPELDVVWSQGDLFGVGDDDAIALIVGSGLSVPMYRAWDRVTQRNAADCVRK